MMLITITAEREREKKSEKNIAAKTELDTIEFYE